VSSVVKSDNFSYQSRPPRVMLVTGGGRGIGAATCRLAAERGWAVCVNYRSDRASAESVAEAINAAGGKALAVQADVAVELEVMRLFDALDRDFGRLDCLVNNAGILERQGRLEDFDAARITRVLAANVTGTLLCAREAVKRMSTRHGGRGGSIVNVSSMAAKLGGSGEYVDYAASKGAVDAFTVGLAKEVAAEAVRVNAVRPGVIHTEIHASGGEPGRVERVRSSVPMLRGGEPAEVARAILFLASDESTYSTGTFIDVSGGR
jgi:NAD(P)-dependent dehydrogenase (short-subunit alcohol dehydrogenase family)